MLLSEARFNLRKLNLLTCDFKYTNQPKNLNIVDVVSTRVVSIHNQQKKNW